MKTILDSLELMVSHLVDIRNGARTLAESQVDAGEAQSIADLRTAADVALDNMGDLRLAISLGDADKARDIVRTLRDHVQTGIAAEALVEDLRAAVQEAENDLTKRVGMHRNRFKSFIEVGNALLVTIGTADAQSDAVHQLLENWTPQPIQEEPAMADQDNATDILAELQGIGRQISFLGTATSVPGQTVTGAGRYPSVSEQMMATLDALGLPHQGVQFATGDATDTARSDLIEGLLDNFRAETRDGNPVFVPGRSDERRRGGKSPQSPIQSGAARVAARLARAEADNILDILDRLPDMTRFRIRQGVPSAIESRRIVADRFDDLDEVMADIIGVNLPRARFTLRRIAKALLDFFDYANLERELVDELGKLGGGVFVGSRLPQPLSDDDEVGQRRPVVQSEELRSEIKELAASFMRLVERVLSPLLDTLGTTAARLEQSLTVAYGSALSLRDILVRSGSSLPEQDVQFFTTGITVEIEEHATRRRGGQSASHLHFTRRPIILSTRQVLDWITEVSEPYVGSGNRAGTMEREDFEILADELESQVKALDLVTAESRRLGFAYRLPGPMRQLEELRFHINAAALLANELIDDSAHPHESTGETND
ncbi:MAG: hypothetical protein WBN04_13000 [Paracoccaceae bacterium]